MPAPTYLDRPGLLPGAGGEITREMEDADYGSTGFTMRDPEGNLWSFGTYRGEPRKG